MALTDTGLRKMKPRKAPAIGSWPTATACTSADDEGFFQGGSHDAASPDAAEARRHRAVCRAGAGEASRFDGQLLVDLRVGQAAVAAVRRCTAGAAVQAARWMDSAWCRSMGGRRRDS